jgi:hypothetical protein
MSFLGNRDLEEKFEFKVRDKALLNKIKQTGSRAT